MKSLQHNSKLKTINLIGNKLGNLRELKILEKLNSLKVLKLHDEEFGTNPFCKKLNTYYSEILMMNNCEKLTVDEHTFFDIVHFLEEGSFK